MAVRQLSFTDIADDGTELDATVELRGTDEQVQRKTADLMRAMARRRGPASVRPPAPVAELEAV